MGEENVRDIIEELLLNQELNVEDENIAIAVVNGIASMSLSDLVAMIQDSNYPKPEISAANISQFSQFLDVNEVVRIVMDSGYDNISFVDLGYFLTGKKSDMAKRKYGENHYKLAAQLGFVTAGEPHCITWLGKAYRSIEDKEVQERFLYKISIRVPIVQRIILEAKQGPVSGSEIMSEYLSESTMCRRRSNIRKMISQMRTYADEGTESIFNNVGW